MSPDCLEEGCTKKRQGQVNNKGYGRFSTWVETHRRHLAHRYALRDLGLLEPGMVVLHRCDNPPCCNPAHLDQGTQADNIHDMQRKGRMNTSGLALGRERRRQLLELREKQQS